VPASVRVEQLLAILGQSGEARGRPGFRDHEGASNRTNPTPMSDPRADAVHRLMFARSRDAT